MKIVVEMPWEKDLSVNTYRFGRPAPGQRFRRRKPHVQAWMDRLASEVWIFWLDLERPIFMLPLRVRVEFRFPDRRRRDDHNYYKAISDAVAKGLVAGDLDDREIRISTQSLTVDRENPGFTIEVSDES